VNLHLKEDCDWFANSANGVLCVAGPLDRRGGSFKYRSLDRSQKVTTWLIDSQGAQAWNKGWLLVIIGRSICRVLTYLLFFTFFCVRRVQCTVLWSLIWINWLSLGTGFAVNGSRIQLSPSAVMNMRLLHTCANTDSYDLVLVKGQ